MTIPVIIVDDEELDRYLVKRRLAKVDEFGDLIEMTSGDAFLDQYFNDKPVPLADEEPVLILMDVNMPGSDGFQTIEEIQRRIAEGKGPGSVMIMMFTSSGNVRDKKRANQLGLVKGYITKPLDKNGVSYILEVYKSETDRAG